MEPKSDDPVAHWTASYFAEQRYSTGLTAIAGIAGICALMAYQAYLDATGVATNACAIVRRVLSAETMHQAEKAGPPLAQVKLSELWEAFDRCADNVDVERLSWRQMSSSIVSDSLGEGVATKADFGRK